MFYVWLHNKRKFNNMSDDKSDVASSSYRLTGSHALPVIVWVSTGISSILPLPKNM